MNRLITLFLCLMPLFGASAQDVLKIDEQGLWKSVLKSPPSVQLLEASFLSEKYKNSMFNDQFTPQLTARTSYSKSQEKQLSSFAPVTSPYHAHSLGVAKKTKKGVQVGLELYSTQTTNTHLLEATTAGIKASVALDLYKDFAGKLTNAQSENLRMASEYAEFDKEIRIKNFFNNVRRVYWALVANNEAMKLTKNLIDHSEKQVSEAKRRLKSRIADEGEVARYQSQLASRQAQLFKQEYDREDLINKLKQMLPEYANHSIVLADYDIQQTVANVLACTVVIDSKGKTPFEFTVYDEMADLLRSRYQQEQKVTIAHDKMDLKLISEFSTIGKDFSYGDSFQDLTDSAKPAYKVGLQLTIPLGSQMKDTRSLKQELDKKRYLSQIEDTMGKMDTYHHQLVRSIMLLKKVVQNQELNTNYLSKSLKSSQKKFNQARINVQQLVQEQDLYLQSSLDEINVKSQVIATLLDYFNIFTNTPCQFNEFKI